MKRKAWLAGAVILILGLVSVSFSINADSTANIVLSKDKLGIFALPSDTVATDLGAGWVRLAVLWKDYDRNPLKFITQQENYVSTKTLYTIRAISGAKTDCYIDQETLNKRRSSLTPEQFSNPANFASCFPKDIDEYKTFVKQLVAGLKGSVQAWQIENEVFGRQINYWSGDKMLGEIDNYLTLLDNASAEIRKADPAALVLASGIALPNSAEFDDNGYLLPISGNENAKLAATTIENNVSKLFKNSCSDFDVIDFHLYHTIESIPNRVKWLKRLMSETGCVKPIWTTEEAGPDPDDPAYKNVLTKANIVSESAKDMPRRMRALSDAGIDKIFYLPYQDYSLNSLTENLGLVDKSSKKKPLYEVFQQISGRITTPAISPDSEQSSLGGATVAKIDSSLGTFIPATNPAPNFPATPDEIVALVFNIVISISGAVFLIMLLIGGISYLTASGAEEGLTNGKKIMINAIIGLIITLSSYAIGLWILRAVGLL